MLLFGISIALSVIGAAASILLKRAESASRLVGSLFGVAAAACALAAGCLGMFTPIEPISVATPFFFATFTLLINPLSGLLLVVINLLGVVAWIYGIEYLKEYTGKGIGSLGMFMHIFMAAMCLVLVSDNVFWFLVFFEIMAISSYFLVIVQQDEKSVKAGFLYLVMAHVGYIMIMIAFFVMSSQTGSFDFSSFRVAEFSPAIASVVFVLCFLGFGCKAGMVPFHSWLPLAHPAAPSHISALMSGGMIKIGIFGIVKVTFDLLAASGVELWWGLLVVVIGAVSCVLGIAYAIAERDIKRLLAYCSVENIGIILLGVGTALIGVALEIPAIAGLGLLAALFHLLNHALYKGMLFFGAGSVIYRTHTRDMSKLGGLVRAMPVTALCFFLGALAISAIPPLNGFVSEWFTYQSMLSAALAGGPLVRIVFAFAVVSLALTGALTVVCFVKAFGISFLGAARSEKAHKATEVPFVMKLCVILLTACCICLGIGAPWVVGFFVTISSSVLLLPGPEVAAGITLVNPDLGSAISTPLVAVLLIALITLPLIIRAVFKSSQRQKPDASKEPWQCGYQPTDDMAMRAASFGAPVQVFLKPLYTIRAALAAQAATVSQLFQKTVSGADKAQGLGDRYLVDTVAQGVTWLSKKMQGIEGGNFRIYVLYIIVALVALLCIAIIAGGGAL